jgi:hypothetical protein
MAASLRPWWIIMFNQGTVMRTSLFVLAGCLLLAAPALAGPVNYISQERQVQARAGETQTVDAPDFGPFHGVATASGEDEFTRVSAEARLDSELTESLMSFVARLELQGEDIDPSDDVLDNLGQSASAHAMIVFELTEPHTFRSVQSAELIGQGDLQGILLLTGPDNFGATLSPGLTGLLQPGEYRLDVVYDLSSEASVPLNATYNAMQQIELVVIPLPAAMWPAMGVLAAMGAVAAHRKRHLRPHG